MLFRSRPRTVSALLPHTWQAVGRCHRDGSHPRMARRRSVSLWLSSLWRPPRSESPALPGAPRVYTRVERPCADFCASTLHVFVRGAFMSASGPVSQVRVLRLRRSSPGGPMPQARRPAGMFALCFRLPRDALASEDGSSQDTLLMSPKHDRQAEVGTTPAARRVSR